MINNYLKNICLIIFALIGPVSLPAGGIQRSISSNLDIDNSNEIILNSNTYIYASPEKNSKKISSLSIGTPASILRYWVVSEEERWIRVELSKSIFINNIGNPLKGWIKI
tara:strand:- start:1791 stop:2120 length:330 start_codon:yes stop_codon:yes gene_type:complete